jgi:hypothetical protein
VAGTPPAVQAADVAVRRHAGLDRLDDLRCTGFGDGGARFEAADGRTFPVRVRHVPTGTVRAVSCGPDAKREDPGRFEVELLA